MQKNDIVKLEITDIGVGGEGIGKVDGYTLFVKDAIIGDVIEAKVMKAKKNYGYAKLLDILTPSEGGKVSRMRYRPEMRGVPDPGDEI